jgi:hemolysin III
MKEKIYNAIMQKVDLPTHYTAKEEKVNCITHLAGTILSAIALIFILLRPVLQQETPFSPGLLIFGISMTILYLSSTLYHGVKHEFIKKILRVCDHASIYLLIAGTYTPIALAINTPKSGLILGIVWGMAALGITLKIIFWGKYKALHLASYILMGWIVVFFWKDIQPALSTNMLITMIAGGIIYTVGTILYSIPKVPYSHGIWHLFVLSGSAAFFTGIILFL